MTIYVVHGFPGAGKGIVAIGRMTDYVRAGRHVATNMDVNLRRMAGVKAKNCRVTRIPDFPCWEDFDRLPSPNQTHDDNKNGGLFLDECALYLNSHDYRDKTIRPGILKFLVQSRKLRWDVFLIIQDPDSLDAQVKRACGEHSVYCMRTDRLSIPYIGWLLSFMAGTVLRLPKVHIGTVRYGRASNSTFVTLWTYRGKEFYLSYDTHQTYDPDFNSYNYNSDSGWVGNAGHCYLPPARINYGVTKWNWVKRMKLTKIYFRSLSRYASFALGACVVAAGFLYHPVKVYVDSNATSAVWNSLARLSELRARTSAALGSAPDAPTSLSPVSYSNQSKSPVTIRVKLDWYAVRRNGRQEVVLRYKGRNYSLSSFPYVYQREGLNFYADVPFESITPSSGVS